MSDRLIAKDKVTLLGRQFDEYIVVVHTDEELLRTDNVARYLAGASFGPFTQIDRAFMLLSYDPSRRGYPYFRL